MLRSALLALPFVAASLAAQERFVTEDLTLSADDVLTTPLVVAADGITIDGHGATISGPGTPGEPSTLRGIGIRLEGRKGVTIRNLAVHGFETGLAATDGEGLLVEGCDFSDNYHDPEHGWGDGNRNGGIILTRVHGSTFRDNRANRVWNGIDLWECDDNRIEGNDFSHCSNVCCKLWNSDRNRVVDNDLSWGLRMKPGEVHARDSTCVLIESGSDDNHFAGNDITHGGDGVFIRPLNGWVSTGNVFVENDCSYANNNGFESWSPGNTFLRNKANHCSYGFWLGGSDNTVLIGNEAAYNGLPAGRHNAPESDFRHGGIVIVHGSGSHSLLDGNWCHDNNGGGIVFRGDLGTRGEAWKMVHLVVQRNVLENNRWGIFGRFTDRLFLAGNEFEGNEEDEFFEDVTNVARGDGEGGGPAPVISIDGPGRANAGENVEFGARIGPEHEGDPNLRFAWDVGGTPYDGVDAVAHVFPRPGFYRVSLTVDDGHLAGLAFRDLYVVGRAPEPATEGGAAQWGGILGNDPEGRGSLLLEDAGESIVGHRSVHLRPDPYPGGEVTAVYPEDRDAAWDLSAKTTLSFWLRFRNPNHGFDGPTIVRLHAGASSFTYVPVAGGRPVNLLRNLPYPEARYGWVLVEVPLAGGEGWIRSEGFEGEVPPHHDRDLEFVTIDTPLETQQATSLCSAGEHLYCASIEGDRLWRSSDGIAWEERRSPRADLGSHGDWINGMLAHHDGGLILRHRDPARDEFGVEWSRLVRYDLATGAWSWLPTRLPAGHGSTVVGDHLFAIAHAIGPNFGGAIARVDLTGPPVQAERTALSGMVGPNDWWLSRAAQLAELGGLVYGIKNDWATPQPTGDDASGDRLFAFDPDAFEPSAFAGGEPWQDRHWKAGWTPITDLGPLPFEPGHGASLVALPPRWCEAIGEAGGLFLTAGCSPSDHEGHGQPSSLYALFDVASRAFTVGTLPDVTGTATSAAFHDGKVFVKRGGMNFAAFNGQLWVVTPRSKTELESARAAGERPRMDLAAVDSLSLQFDANGHRPFDLWIDGLQFE